MTLDNKCICFCGVRILVIGGGGREHALTWKLANDSCRPEMFCAPGNAGTAGIAQNLAVGAEDLDGLMAWARENRPELTVVGPEAPLCAGIADLLEAESLPVFGPSKAAARIEGSKLFSKEVMQAGGVPTADARRFDRAAAARRHVAEKGVPIVIKADGLAAGKGVYVCSSVEEAHTAIDEVLVQRVFGDSGNELIIEDCLEGEEASILALVDGETVVMLASSQDHKRIFDGDRGPNTGGMGAYSPAPVISDDLWPVIREQVFERTLAELRKRGITYRGVLYAGLMIKEGVPSVLEFNCRFGDPEIQAIVPRIDGDLLPAIQACIAGNLSEDLIRWRPESCVCVVMASGGYPGSYGKGNEIGGLEEAEKHEEVVVFHAGTRQDNGRTVASGGRVLGVTALGTDLPAALKEAYAAVSKIHFDEAQWRTDIGQKALNRASG